MMTSPSLTSFCVVVFIIPMVQADGLNLALGKPAYLSTTNGHYTADLATDGNKNSVMHQGSCVHSTETVSDLRPWLLVDLGQQYEIHYVSITNRGDCCGSRSNNFQILVGNSFTAPSGFDPEMFSQCFHETSQLQDGETRNLQCNTSVVGRYVAMYKDSEASSDMRVITICEFQVFGPDLNLALLKPAYLSTTNGDYTADRATDGNKNSVMHQGSCVHSTETASDLRPWFLVDLGQQYKIDNVSITNRGDCCGTRTRNFQILVGNIFTAPSGFDPEMFSLCFHETSQLQAGETRNLECATPVVGRYVAMYKDTEASSDMRPITICEFQVFGTDMISVHPVVH